MCPFHTLSWIPLRVIVGGLRVGNSCQLLESLEKAVLELPAMIMM